MAPSVPRNATSRDVITLRDYFEAKLEAVGVRLDALDKAVSIAAAAMDKRMDLSNEVRAQLKDQAATFMPRAEAMIIFDRMAEDIRVLREARSQMDGRVSMSGAFIVFGVSVVAILVTAANVAIQMIFR